MLNRICAFWTIAGFPPRAEKLLCGWMLKWTHKQQCECENDVCASIKTLLKLTVLTELRGDGFRHSDFQILLNKNNKLKRAFWQKQKFFFLLQNNYKHYNNKVTKQQSCGKRYAQVPNELHVHLAEREQSLLQGGRAPNHKHTHAWTTICDDRGGKRLSESVFASSPWGCWERSNPPHTSQDKRHGWSGWIQAFASTCPQTKWYQCRADNDGFEREEMRCEKLHLLPPGLWRTTRSPWRSAVFLWSWSVCRGQHTGSRAVEGSEINSNKCVSRNDK